MECMKLFGLDFSLGMDWKMNLLFLLLLLLFFFFFCFLCCFFLAFRCIWISCFFAGADTKPFWKPGLWSFLEFCKLFLPAGFKGFSSQNFSSAFVQLFPVSISSGVSSAFVLGEHVDGWGVGTGERFWV